MKSVDTTLIGCIMKKQDYIADLLAQSTGNRVKEFRQITWLLCAEIA